MKLTCRLTQAFAELKVDEIESTVFRDSEEPIETIYNLLEVIEDLCNLTGRHFHYTIKENQED